MKSQLDVLNQLRNLDIVLQETTINKEESKYVVNLELGEQLREFVGALRDLGFKGDSVRQTGHPSDHFTVTERGDFGVHGHRCGNVDDTKRADLREYGDRDPLFVGGDGNYSYNPDFHGSAPHKIEGSSMKIELSEAIVRVIADPDARKDLVQELTGKNEGQEADKAPRTWSQFLTGQGAGARPR